MLFTKRGYMNIPIENINTIFTDAQKKCVKACIATVNIQAAQTRKNAIVTIQSNFILRNKWTTTGSNLNFQQCPQSVTDITQIQSEVGSKLDYMERQEKGGLHKPTKGKQLAIPNTNARLGSTSKPVARSLYLSRNKLVSGPLKKSGSRSSNFVARAFVASSNKLFLSMNKTLFKVTSFKKSGESVSFKKTPMYNIKFSETKTKASPWLQPSAEQPAKDAQSIYNFQLDKLFS